MVKVFISGGSNISPEKNIPKAIHLLNECCKIISISKMYRTKAVGAQNTPDFINFALMLETETPAYELKYNILREIEKKVGRIRSEDKNKPRKIDLDIILYGNQVIDELQIPDPDLLKYAYISYPLSDLDPNFIHPLTGEKLIEIAKRHIPMEIIDFIVDNL